MTKIYCTSFKFAQFRFCPNLFKNLYLFVCFAYIPSPFLLSKLIKLLNLWLIFETLEKL